MRLDLIIPTKGRPHDLCRGLRILNECFIKESPSGLGVRVCISDSSEMPLTSDFFDKACPYIPVTYHHAPHNRRFIENLKSAIYLSNADYLWLMGDDDFLMPGALTELALLIVEGFSLLHSNAFLKNSNTNTKTLLVSGVIPGQHEQHVSSTRSVEDLTYMSCLVFKREILQDDTIWRMVQPCEVASHLRFVVQAVRQGGAIATGTPMVVIEKNDEVVAEWNGNWSILLGYEIPLVRHHFLNMNLKIKHRSLKSFLQEIRMHLILSIFRKSYPLLAYEASGLRHQYPGVKSFKKLTFQITRLKTMRRLMQRLGTFFDSRCADLEI